MSEIFSLKSFYLCPWLKQILVRHLFEDDREVDSVVP